jgi:glycosyltransferase involved in cell wall biosynthesis
MFLFISTLIKTNIFVAMRIAFATTEFLTEKIYDGGLSNYIFRVSLSLKSLGHEPIVFVSSNQNNKIEYKGIKVIQVKGRAFTWWYWLLNGLTFFRFNPALLMILRSYRIKEAIIKQHQLKKLDIVQYTNLMALGILKPKLIPCVLRISSYQKLIDNANGEKQSFRLWQKQYLQDKMLKSFQNIYGPSKIIADYIYSKLKKEVKIIETPFVMQNGALDNQLVNKIKKNTNSSPYLLYFGSISQLKGLLDIGQIIEAFFLKYSKYYFVFIGKDILFNKRSTIKTIKLNAGKFEDRVLWFNSTPHHLLYPVIQNAEMVVLPSRLDNFPNTCIEAMAFGKVVIGTYKTSFEQLIDHKISGILCEHTNPKSLMEAIDYGMSLSQEEKNKMGEKAQERVNALRPEIVVKQLLDYYNMVINQ